MGVPYVKLLLFVTLPAVVLIPISLFWLLWGKAKDRSEIAMNYCVATVTITWFTIHPMILANVMSFFK